MLFILFIFTLFMFVLFTLCSAYIIYIYIINIFDLLLISFLLSFRLFYFSISAEGFDKFYLNFLFSAGTFGRGESSESFWSNLAQQIPQMLSYSYCYSTGFFEIFLLSFLGMTNGVRAFVTNKNPMLF